MAKVLLVYENIPESTDVYLLDVEDKDLKWMKKCHRYYGNTEMPKEAEAACEKLSLYLEDKEKAILDFGLPLQISGYDWLISGYDWLIHTGFMM